MDVKDWLYLVGLLISLIVGAIGAYPAIWSVKSATRKTDVDAVKVALEIAGIDAKEQLELKQTVQHLKDIIEKRRYRVRVDFRLGDKPTIDSATIDVIDEEIYDR